MTVLSVDSAAALVIRKTVNVANLFTYNMRYSCLQCQRLQKLKFLYLDLF